MDGKQIKNLKANRVIFLVFGIIVFIIGIPVPFLWVLSAVLFFLAYATNKEYKKQLAKANEEKRKHEVPVQPVAKKEEKVKVVDLNGNTLMISPLMKIEGTEDVLIAEGGRTFHTSIGCFKKWKPEMQEGFEGWKIIKRSEALKMGMKYCAFCEEASRVTLDDLEEFEDNSDDI